jgi:hypothetical protein
MPIIVFSPATDEDNSQIEGGTHVVVYRFGDRRKPGDWESPRRREGNLAPPPQRELNDLALSQVRFGRKGAVGSTPFISVATSFTRLFENAEPWVQGILRSAPDMGEFVVPFDCVMRPSINSHATKAETEWLYYDLDHPILGFLRGWQANPFRTP